MLSSCWAAGHSCRGEQNTVSFFIYFHLVFPTVCGTIATRRAASTCRAALCAFELTFSAACTEFSSERSGSAGATDFISTRLHVACSRQHLCIHARRLFLWRRKRTVVASAAAFRHSADPAAGALHHPRAFRGHWMAAAGGAAVALSPLCPDLARCMRQCMRRRAPARRMRSQAVERTSSQTAHAA